MKLVGEGNAVEEGLWSFACGVLFGATTVVVGHPFDTIKTRMQAQAKYSHMTARSAAIDILKTQGVRGFYSGFIPPFIGSSIFRSVQFAAYGFTVALFRDENSIFRQTKFFGVETRVLLGGIVSGASRALIESPLDFLKTQRQVGSSLRTTSLSVLYRGFTATLARNIFLMTTFFSLVDFLSGSDPFITGGIATTAAWTLVWPLDVAKSRMQASLHDPKPLVYTIREIAVNGLMFRGYFAGITRSFLANGASLKVYNYAQSLRMKHYPPTSSCTD